MFDKLIEKGVRMSVEAEETLSKYGDRDSIIEELLTLNKPFITKEDIESAERKMLEVVKTIEPQPQMKIEVIRENGFKPLSKEYSADVKLMHTRDVTGKSRSKGEAADFLSYFKSRYEKISKLLRGSIGTRNTLVELKDIGRYKNEKVRVIVSVMAKSDTKKGNLLLEIEDLTGNFKVVVSSNQYSRDKEKLFEKSKQILLDDVVAISGKVLDAFIIAEEIEWPDMPIMRRRKITENDLAIAYISDMHFGSKYYLERYLDAFVEWIHGKGEAKELASKVKYIAIAGDIVDGIGIYPNQEKELVVKDIYKQYEMFDDFLEKLPDYVEVITIPGNHDAVRRGEPMPAIPKDLVKNDRLIRGGNPAFVEIEGLKHILYHGTSMDSLIAALPNANYTNPEKVMVEYLKRRHLSPIYGGNLIIPEKVDYFVIDEEPDVLHCGHVHKNGHADYRGTLVINSGTFQDRTEYQVKQGHVPTPAMVYVYETKYGKLKTLDFKS